MADTSFSLSRHPVPTGGRSIVTMDLGYSGYAGIDLESVTVSWASDGGSLSPANETKPMVRPFATVFEAPPEPGEVTILAQVTYKGVDRVTGQPFESEAMFRTTLQVVEA